jgi:hypothetical protein
MNKEDGEKGRGRPRGKKVCHSPAVDGSFCVIGWFFFGLHQFKLFLAES